MPTDYQPLAERVSDKTLLQMVLLFGTDLGSLYNRKYVFPPTVDWENKKVTKTRLTIGPDGKITDMATETIFS